jgi:nicotinamide-nucleotide amidase
VSTAGSRSPCSRQDGGTRSVAGGLDEATRRRTAERVARLALAGGRTIAVAESLTGGMIASALAEAPQASEWFRGALVAYSTAVKHEVLDVPSGPVVSAEAATAMARRVRTLLRADVAVAVTGAGGPSAQDGEDPGTVFLAVHSHDRDEAVRLDLPGEPPAVCAAATISALDALVAALDH